MYILTMGVSRYASCEVIQVHDDSEVKHRYNNSSQLKAPLPPESKRINKHKNIHNTVSQTAKPHKMPPHHLFSRSYSSNDCPSTSSTCSSHRLAIIVIICFVAIIVSGILSLLYVRSRRSKAAKQQVQQEWGVGGKARGKDGFEEWDAPPAYDERQEGLGVRRPERVVVRG